MIESPFLKAFKGDNETIPVWFMRQAGRSLPEYRALKEKLSFLEMLQDSDIASEVTCMPIKKLGVDAAILFADILTLPMHMGFHINFIKGEGPVISNPIRHHTDLERCNNMTDIPYLESTIKKTKQNLSMSIPLIGFAGSPFTVLTYLIEGGSTKNFTKTFKLMYANPLFFHQLMDYFTMNTIHYLNFQKKAGIQAFQLFDTWGGILSNNEYREFVLPYVTRIFCNIDLPSIYYLRNCSHLLTAMEESGADFLSVCHTIDFENNLTLDQTPCGVQGNLNNTILYAEDSIIERETIRTLEAAKKFKRYIFNLSHGIFPDTDVEKLKHVVSIVHRFKR